MGILYDIVTITRDSDGANMRESCFDRLMQCRWMSSTAVAPPLFLPTDAAARLSRGARYSESEVMPLFEAL